VTLASLREKYKNGAPITAITAYDYPSAVHVRFIVYRFTISNYRVG